jgi:hypothetical protein
MKHEIIFTEHYALIVSDEQAKENDWGYIPSQGGEVKLVHKFFASDWRKIIAHRPLSDAPILKGVPLLPEFSEEDDVENIAYNWFVTADKKTTIFDLGWVNIFTAGYNKAKETYKYTEDDLRKALLIKHDGLSVDYVIQSLQQSKRPKYFECETITMNKGYTDKSDYPYQECEILKTTNNSQNQTELIGTYYYE